MYDADHARIYDFLYTEAGKDYRVEADALVRLAPGAASVLDVACGTGEHLRFLRRRFARVVGGVVAGDGAGRSGEVRGG